MTELRGSDAPAIVLVDASSEAERRLVEGALPDLGERQVTVAAAEGRGARRAVARRRPGHARDGAPGGLGTPPSRGRERRPADARARRRTWRCPCAGVRRRPLQKAALRRDPERARVVVAEPATVAELSGRWDGTGSLTRFVAQPGGARPRPRRARRGRQTAPRCPGTCPRRSSTAPSSGARCGSWPSGSSSPRRRCAPTPSAALRGAGRRDGPGRGRGLHRRCSGRCTPGRGTVQADTAGLEKLRELNRRYPLVFLPSHRSYVDPLVLADVLAEHDFPRNHVLGGDNLRFWPLGPLAKRAGIVFIRRSFGDDQVYKLAVRGVLRLPAGQALQPRVVHGGRPLADRQAAPAAARAAGYVADAVERGRVDDVYLVPVSITYDQLREVSLMAAEQGGAAEAGRGAVVAGVATPATQLRTPLGTVHVGFAEPLSLRRGADAGADPDDPDARRLALQKVAFEVAVGINSRHPGDGDGAGHPGPARGARPGADARARCSGCSSRVLRLPDRAGPAALRRGAAHRPRAAAGARARWRAGRRHGLRRRRGAGLRDRARPAPRRGVLPQQRDPPLRRPGDRRAGAAARARRTAGTRRCGCATC